MLSVLLEFRRTKAELVLCVGYIRFRGDGGGELIIRADLMRFYDRQMTVNFYSFPQVLGIEGWETDTARSVAKVQWSSNKESFQYRIGHKGKIDLKCVATGGDAVGGQCYPDHLPVLGRSERPSPSAAMASSVPGAAGIPAAARRTQFAIGESVKIAVDLEVLRKCQGRDSQI